MEVLARQKEVALQLLQAYAIPYEVVGRSRPTLLWKGIGLFLDDLRVLRVARRKGIEFMLSTGIPGSAHASRVLGVPHVALIDTEIAVLGRLLAEPFSDAVCTPQCFRGEVRSGRHIRINGYLELMYLRPNYFRPDASVLDQVGLSPGERYAIVRFSSSDSSHDLGYARNAVGSDEDRCELVKGLSKSYRVFVVTETVLPQSLKSCRLNLPPERFHDLLAFADLYVGEGATTASEAGVLGVPWIYLSKSRRGYLDDQEERYGTGRTVNSLKEVLPVVESLVAIPRSEWARRRELLLETTVDVTRFVVDLVDGWPESRGQHDEQSMILRQDVRGGQPG